MYNNSANYIGQYVELTNVPTEATSECNIGVTVYDASAVQIQGQPAPTFTVDDEVVLPTASKVGYTFVGWFDGETKVEKIAKGTIGAMTLTAKWEMIVVKHNVEFELNGGVCTTLPTEYEEGKGLVLPTPTKEGCTFLGWYDNAECTGTPVVVPSADCELYAKWSKETVTLTYVLGDVEATLDQTEVLVHVSDSFDLATPTYNSEYLKFNGWYLEPECVTIVRDVKEYTTENMTVYASWTEISGYTINLSLIHI